MNQSTNALETIKGTPLSCNTDLNIDCRSLYCRDIGQLEGTGAYNPLLLAPLEGLGGPSGPLASGGNIFYFLMKKIQENPLTFV